MAKITKEEFIERAKKVHGDKYDYSKVDYLKIFNDKVTIICPIHGEFEQAPNRHVTKRGCPKCSGNQKLTTEGFIERAKEVHGDRYDYPKTIYVNSKTKIIVTCPEHGDFPIRPSNHLRGSGCLVCANQYTPIKEEFLSSVIEIHEDKYDYSKMDYIDYKTKITIICPIHGDFDKFPWAHLKNKQGCPICANGFTKEYKLKLIDAISIDDLINMDPFELLTIIAQGKLPIEFKPLVNDDAGSEDRIVSLAEIRNRIANEADSGESSTTTTPENPAEEEEAIAHDDVDEEIANTNQNRRTPALPIINPVNDMHLLDNDLYAGMDDDAIDALVNYKLRKLWNDILNERISLEAIENENGGTYFTKIKDTFLTEYNQVVNYTPPLGYSFPFEPNMMQKLTVNRIIKNKAYGNWSGTGAGKTLSFIITSREIDAKLTIVVCLNSTVEQLGDEIKGVYPDSVIHNRYEKGFVFDRTKNNYLILNYEKFQLNYSEEMFRNLTDNNQIDFVVIDEVHNAKQRTEEESKRRVTLNRLLGRARENENLHTLVMSATPVINNLTEAVSLLNLLTGLDYDDLKTIKSLPNALKIFCQLTIQGLRYLPRYDIIINELTGKDMSYLDIDGSYLLDDLLELKQSNVSNIEILLLEPKLERIQGSLKKGTIIYSYYTTGLISKINSFVKSRGFKTATYTGEEDLEVRAKNLKDFIDGKVDILIGSRPIGTGVDGLQKICDRMIILSLPWTDSEYTQLKGRIHRQGSIFGSVEIIIPQVKIPMDNGEIWSWDIQRLNLIRNKRTLADAVVDGIIPSRILPSAETLKKKSIESLKLWKDRISAGDIMENERIQSKIDLYPELSDEDRIARINSELSDFNRRGKTTHSTTMNREFTANPDSWHRYHALRNARMETWDEIPYEHIATLITDPRDIVVDFGCGEAGLRLKLPNNKVYSFDHIACNEYVIACDIKDVSEHLKDESVDVAVFSLALWGTNHADYIKEAHRVLGRKGMIYISEPSNHYGTEEEQAKLVKLINDAGFQTVGGIENRGKFIYLTGIKI